MRVLVASYLHSTAAGRQTQWQSTPRPWKSLVLQAGRVARCDANDCQAEMRGTSTPGQFVPFGEPHTAHCTGDRLSNCACPGRPVRTASRDRDLIRRAATTPRAAIARSDPT